MSPAERQTPGHTSPDARKPADSSARVLVLRVLVCVALCGAGVAAIVCLSNWAPLVPSGVAVGVLLVALLLAPRLWPGPRPGSPPRRPSGLLRVLGGARRPLAALLAAWLGLIAWALAAPGGGPPEPKADPATIRIVTWNVLRGQDSGPPWEQANWPARKGPLRAALAETGADVVCLQEALAGQLASLEEGLRGYRRVGTPRRDGEHCAVLYAADRFEALGEGTFWLEDPVREPGLGPGWVSGPRICTWVRLRDRAAGRTFRLYNLHSYLTEEARLGAARLVAAQIAAGDPADPVVLAGDFNAPPGEASRRAFAAAGLEDAAALAGGRPGEPTYQWYGVGLRCLDGVLVGPGWRVLRHRVLDVKPENTFPSDHFGLLADLAFRE